MEPDLKITPGQRPASCESPPDQNSHRGPQLAAGKKHAFGQLAAPSHTWRVRVSVGWLVPHFMLWHGEDSATVWTL